MFSLQFSTIIFDGLARNEGSLMLPSNVTFVSSLKPQFFHENSSYKFSDKNDKSPYSILIGNRTRMYDFISELNHFFDSFLIKIDSRNFIMMKKFSNVFAEQFFIQYANPPSKVFR